MNEAMWALVGVAVGAIASGLFNWLMQRSQFAHDKEMFHLQNKSAEMAKEILREKLHHQKHVSRSFSALRNAIGGYPDDQIRKLLLEIGAKRTLAEGGTEEWWHLNEREDEYLARRAEDSPHVSEVRDAESDILKKVDAAKVPDE